MGTSSSSSGPGSGVPFDPPWLISVASEIGSPLVRRQSKIFSKPDLQHSLWRSLPQGDLATHDGIWVNMQAVVTGVL